MQNIILILFLFFLGCTSSNEKESPISTHDESSQEVVLEEKDKIIINTKSKEKNLEEKPNSSNEFKIPNEFIYSKFIPADFCKTQSHCYIDKVYPIGWSSKGKIAYINEHPPNNVGTIFKFIIQDMISDKIIWSKRWVEEADNIQQLWSNNKMEIIQKLKYYSISQNSQTLELMEFPIEMENEDYLISFSEAHDEKGFLNQQKLYMKSKSLGKKKIYDKKVKTHGGLGLSQSKIIGAFKSPYEDRVAILKLNELNQIEGDKELQLEFIGCYLKK